MLSSSIEIYAHNREERIARTWGTTAPELPYVQEALANSGTWLVGGDLEVLERIKYNDGLDNYRLSPAELRAEFERREVCHLSNTSFPFDNLYELGKNCAHYIFVVCCESSRFSGRMRVYGIDSGKTVSYIISSCCMLDWPLIALLSKLVTRSMILVPFWANKVTFASCSLSGLLLCCVCKQGGLIVPLKYRMLVS